MFQVPVDPAMEPEYHNIIVHPMDMSQLEKNIKKKMYGSTQAFLADAMWILHNSILYNGSKFATLFYEFDLSRYLLAWIVWLVLELSV